MTMGLFLSANDLDALFPARIEATREGRIIRLGASLERLIGPHQLGVGVLDIFAVERPARVKRFADLLAKSAHVVLRARDARSVRVQGVAHVAGDLVYLLVGHTLDLASESEPLLTHSDFSPADGSSEAFLAAAVQAQFAADARRLAYELEHARKAAETASNAKSAFLANVTHELRTPLNAVIGYSELMRENAVEDGRDADTTDHDHVLTAAKGLLNMINDVLDYTRLETQRLAIESETFAVRELLDALCDEMTPSAAVNGNTLRHACEFGLTCRADAAVVERCMRQLISNAMKFTAFGEIVVCAYRDADQLVIEVCDTGVGIDEEVLADLFVAFRKRPDECGGAGLGLALTQRLAEALGGEVLAESAPGVGSTFSLRVPVVFEVCAVA